MYSKKTSRCVDVQQETTRSVDVAARKQSQQPQPSTSSSSSAKATATTTPNTKSEDSGCPSSDCEQASASSKDMLLSREQKSISSNRNSGEFMYMQPIVSEASTSSKAGNGDCHDEKAIVAPESKGAIPKTHMGHYDKNEESPPSTALVATDADALTMATSGASSQSTEGENQKKKSLRRSFSSLSIRSGCDPMAVEVFRQLYEEMLEEDERATSMDSSLESRRERMPPVLPMSSTRADHIFPVTRKPYLCLHPSYRQYQPKLRSSRNRRQNSSLDTTTSSRGDEDNSSMVAVAGGCGSSLGTGSGWDFLDIEVQESINTFIIQELIEDQYSFKKQSLPVDTIGGIGAGVDALQQASVQMQQHQQQRAAAAINRMGYADSVFWGHYNLPSEKQMQPKRYFKFPVRCFGRKRDIKISMDRLQLLALFDRDFGWCQTILSILLAATVSILGSIVLCLGFYKDLFAFIFSFVIASSQFSLLKSVQPDAASPVHGFNKTVAYSRPIYFCICSTILIIAYQLSSATPSTAATAAPPHAITLFGLPFAAINFFCLVQDVMAVVLLLLPLLFSFGLFPQINTFLMYVLEQVDMHTFGGNAVCSLSSAFFGIFRSLLACCMLYGFAFGALSEPRSTQHVLFSCFCALIVATSYHLSRSASDFTYLWAIIKSSLALHVDDDESGDGGGGDADSSEEDSSNNAHRSDANFSRSCANEANANTDTLSSHGRTANTSQIDVSDSEVKDKSTTKGGEQQPTNAAKDDLDDPLPGKLKSTVNARLKNDFLVCIVIGVLVFSLHSSTVFTVLQPELNPILQTFAIVLGLLLHYVLPQMRKYLPWLCFAKPILKQKEYGLYETSDAAKIMWFENVYVCLTFFERNVLLPLVFISALTSESAAVVHKFGVPIGAVIVVLCGIKSKFSPSQLPKFLPVFTSHSFLAGIRCSYSDPSSQFIIILFSVLFFRLDYAAGSETFLVDSFIVSIVYKKTSEFLLKVRISAAASSLN